MFGNKNKKTDTKEEEILTKVNQDMIVRNMPSLARVSGTIPRPSEQNAPAGETQSSNLSSMSVPKSNFKMVGVVIIAGGLLLIGGLVYLSYVYIIKPQTTKTKTPVVNIVPEKVSVVNTPRATATDEVLIATTSLVATVTPSTLDISTSTDSIIMNEELGGKQNVNLPPLLDTDADGLNDQEEAVLGTNLTLADSNGNTYSDLVEINNNYNPVASGKLSENSNLAKYTNKVFGYEILYPKDWLVNSLNQDSVITFTAPDDSIIQISAQENTDRQSILGWYDSSFADSTITYDKLKTTSTWDGIYSNDNLNFYLTDKKRTNVYVVSYVPAVDSYLAYPNIFALMVNSLSLK